MPGDLNEKQRKFVAEYVVDCNGKQAAIRAGYAPHSAEVTASKLLRQTKVADAVAAERAKLQVLTGITASRVLAELEGMAFARHEHFEADAAGNVTVKGDAPAHVSAALMSVKRKEWDDGKGGHTVEVEWKLHPKFEPLRLAGKHVDVHGFWDRATQEAPDQKPTEVEVYLGLPEDDDATAGTS